MVRCPHAQEQLRFDNPTLRSARTEQQGRASKVSDEQVAVGVAIIFGLLLSLMLTGVIVL
jgi:hypothetical protein